jgi:hypothetical protein
MPVLLSCCLLVVVLVVAVLTLTRVEVVVVQEVSCRLVQRLFLPVL